MPMIFLISPVSDNIKHEKDSRWMYYVSTLPSGRKSYVNSYFSLYSLLILLGLVIGMTVVFLFKHDISLAILSGFVGIGAAGTYAIMLPLTFKFGPDNSNAIFLITSIIAIALFFFMFFTFIMPSINTPESFLKIAHNPHQLLITGTYGLIGIFLIIISYILSVILFSKQEL